MATPAPLFAGNWKMNGTRASLAEVAAVRDAVAAGRTRGADVLICPPFTLVTAAADLCAGTGLAIGGQDCDPEPAGASTGDVSAEMLRDAGAGAVIVGHSERRARRGDTDAVVRAKAEAAARAGLMAVLCVGERRDERDRGEALDVIGRQVEGSVPPGARAAGLALAYEPVWAIGTGAVPSEGEIAEVHAFLRDRLRSRLGPEGGNVRLLYGGSVKADNAGAILGVAEVDGVLVGGASLDARSFLAIVEAVR